MAEMKLMTDVSLPLFWIPLARSALSADGCSTFTIVFLGFYHLTSYRHRIVCLSLTKNHRFLACINLGVGVPLIMI